MMEVRRLAICDPNNATREPLRNMLLGVESVYLEAESNRYEFFPDVIEQYRPEIAIVVLDSDFSTALQLVGQLGEKFPNISILAVSSRTDGPFILQVLRLGAKEFLPLPIQLEELLAALDRIGYQGGDGSTPGLPTGGGSSSIVMAVAGSRGGIGCTSVAVNLACCLSTIPENRVVLLDLDLALGDSNITLDFTPTYTLADLANNINDVDQKYLKGVLYKHFTGLMVLSRPENLDDIGLIHEEHVLRLISLLRASFTHVVIDLSKSFRPTDVAAMRAADLILLLAQLELTSVHNVNRLLNTFKTVDGLFEKVRIVMNRVGAEDQKISLKKAEEFVGQGVYWQLNNDSRSMLGSRNEGKPLIQFAPKSKVCQDLMGLARSLSLSSTEAVQPEEKPAKKGGFSLFGSRRSS